jgi:hypothetical protein
MKVLEIIARLLLGIKNELRTKIIGFVIVTLLKY